MNAKGIWRFHWLTNIFGSQTSPEAKGHVCFQVAVWFGIWASKSFNSTAVVAGSLRTSVFLIRKVDKPLLFILFAFRAALKYIFSAWSAKPFYFLSSSIPSNCGSLSEVALTARIVEHHDVIYGNVASPLPGNGRLNQHLQKRKQMWMMNWEWIHSQRCHRMHLWLTQCCKSLR